MRMKGGGAYFLISRSLGPRICLVIAFVFFLAQAVSVAMYIIGFTEAFMDTFLGVSLSATQIATIVKYPDFPLRIHRRGLDHQGAVRHFCFIAVGHWFLFGGAISDASYENLATNFSPSFRENDNLFTMFALFFQR